MCNWNLFVSRFDVSFSNTCIVCMCIQYLVQIGKLSGHHLENSFSSGLRNALYHNISTSVGFAQ